MPTGSGPTVLLLHGFATCSATSWEHNGWCALLADSGRQVLPVDLLGHGTAAKPVESGAYDGLENVVLEGLPEEPVDAIGFSMGARVLLVLASRRPERFNRLVVAGVGQNLFEDDPERRREIAEAIRTGKAEDPELAYFARLPESPEADRQALAACLTRPNPPPLAEEHLARIEAPVHVVIGDRDFAGPPDRLVSSIRGATLTTLRGVDHFATPKNFGFIDAALDFIGARPF